MPAPEVLDLFEFLEPMSLGQQENGGSVVRGHVAVKLSGTLPYLGGGWLNGLLGGLIYG